MGVCTPAQIVTEVEPLNAPNTEVGDATGAINGLIAGVSSCPD